MKNLIEIGKKIDAEIYALPTENSNIEPIADGIVNEEMYLKSKFKILWILKEPYDEIFEGKPIGGGWSVAKDALNSKKSGKEMSREKNTFFPMIYTSFGILNDGILWEEMSDANHDQNVFDTIKKIAYINIKKTPGLTVCSSHIIAKHYDNNKKLLLKQIEVYNPDIIIGGGRTLKIMSNDLGLNDQTRKFYSDLDKDGKYTHGFYVSNNRIFVDAYHPGIRRNKESYCNNIIEGVCRILKS
jgi:hypothetical protein